MFVPAVAPPFANGVSASVLFTAGVIAAALAAAIVLWFVVRAFGRVFNGMHVPRPSTTYLVFTFLLAGLSLFAGVSLTLARLMSDHQRVAGVTQLGTVTCEAAAGGKMRTTFKPALVAVPALPEVGETVQEAASNCRVEVTLVTMRAALHKIGMGQLARVSSIGQAPRPSKNPEWLTPGRGFVPIGLIVRETNVVDATAVPGQAAAGGTFVLEARAGAVVLAPVTPPAAGTPPSAAGTPPPAAGTPPAAPAGTPR